MLVDVLCRNLNLRLTLADNFLKLLIFLLETLYVAIDDRKSAFKIIDLVIKDLVVGVNGDFRIDQCIHSLGDLLEILSVQALHLLHKRLG